MRKKAKANVTRNGDTISVNYNPKASLEDTVESSAECVSLLAKSLL